MTNVLRIGLAAVAGIVVLAGLGCSQKSETQEVTQAKAPGAKLKVVYIPKKSGIAYFDEVVNGFHVEADKVNVDFTTVAPDSGDATSQIPLIKEQIQKGVNVIAITPNSPDALNAALDEAKAKGVIVLTIDADLVGNETHRAACIMPTDADAVGPAQLDELASELPSGGDFAILSATHDAPNQNYWIAGLKKALADPKYSKLKLVDIVYGDDDPGKSTTEAEALLAKYPNLRGIISPTSAGLPAVAQVLDTAGKYPGGAHAVGGGIVLTGLSTPKQMKKYVDKGVLQKFLLWSPRQMGVLACYLAVKMKAGEIKPDEGVTVSVPALDDHKFGAKGIINASPLVTFDKKNIGQFGF